MNFRIGEYVNVTKYYTLMLWMSNGRMSGSWNYNGCDIDK